MAGFPHQLFVFVLSHFFSSFFDYAPHPVSLLISEIYEEIYLKIKYIADLACIGKENYITNNLLTILLIFLLIKTR
jgi:hypothetical protein